MRTPGGDRRRRAAAIAAVLVVVAVPTTARAACPAPCPWTGVAMIGDRDHGQLRLPQAVAVDAAGRIYVGDQYSHVIQRFGPDGSFQLAFGAPGTGDGEFDAIVGVAVDPADGSIYAADAANDRIQHFTADGAFIAAFGGPGTAAGQFQFGAGGHVEAPAQGGVAVGGGYLWVADAQNDRVQRFPLSDVSGATPSVAGALVISAGGVDNPQGLWFAGSLFVADDIHNVIQVYGVDGSYQRTIGLGGPGSGPGQFDGAYDVAVDGLGHVYAVDDNNHRIQVFDASVPQAPLIGGWGSFGRNPGQFEFPRAITLGPDGFLYVANTADGRIDKFTTAGAFVMSIGLDGRLPGQFISPGYLAASPDGGLGVPDIEGNRLEQFRPDNTVLGTYGGVGSTPEHVLHPEGMAFDGAFDVFVADTDNNRVVERGLYGSVIRVIGDGQFSGPRGVATDGSAVYVADYGNDQIKKFGVDGTPIATWGPTFTGPTAGTVTLRAPRGIALSAVTGQLYVASSSDATNRVLVIDPATGSLISRFGSKGTGNGQFRTPGGIAIDAQGRVYVADIGNDRVQRFASDGTYQAQWGDEGAGAGQFEHPVGVAAACDGTISVADQDNNRVQRFTITDPAGWTCLGTPAPPAPPPPPPAETPAPAPTPPPPPPQLHVAVKTKLVTRVVQKRRLQLTALCDRACTMTVTVTLQPKATATGPKRRLRAVKVTLRAGVRTTMTFRLSKTDGKVLARALKQRTALRVIIAVRATSTGATGATLARTVSARA